ncbi:Rspry1, partial [Symbiodinium sp. CCMP2456]
AFGPIVSVLHFAASFLRALDVHREFSQVKWFVQRLAGKEHVEQISRKGVFWLDDMLSDMYVTYKYWKQKMHGFAFLMISTWLGSGCTAFGHRYVSWERRKHRLDYWAAGLNERGEPRPGFTTFLLYISQIQPMIMAWESWQHGGMDRFLQEEKMLTTLTEGDPNSPMTVALLKAGAMPGPKPQLIGLTALKPAEPPPHGFRWFTCGAPSMAQNRGQFYHEIELLSDFETPQLGWLSSDFQSGEEDGNGVGDDPHSWAFDGQRLASTMARRNLCRSRHWKVGDVLGFAIDLDKGEMQLRTKQEDLTMPFQVSGA